MGVGERAEECSRLESGAVQLEHALDILVVGIRKDWVVAGLKGALSFPLRRFSAVDLELNEVLFIREFIPGVVEALEPVLTDLQIAIGRLELPAHLQLLLPAKAAAIRHQY